MGLDKEMLIFRNPSNLGLQLANWLSQFSKEIAGIISLQSI